MNEHMKSMQLFKDPSFNNGFSYFYSAKGSGEGRTTGKMFGQKDSQPIWRFSHYWSKFSLENMSPVTLPLGGQVYQNDGVKISFECDEEGISILGLDVLSKNEYKNKAYKEGDGFPHLLIEQKLDTLLRIVDIESFRVNYDVKITKCINFMKETEYDSVKHCAHVVSFFAIKNNNPKTHSFGEYFWFGIPVFDSRYDIPIAYRAKDGTDNPKVQKKGTGMFIYTLDGREYWNYNINDGHWHTLNIDILPHILKGFQLSKERGYLNDTKPEDLIFSSFNMGWEVPGTFDAGVQLKNISAEYKLK